uniref:NADH-ubiquinone oxidoreductase chain 6 n=1 Tax=Maesaipsyche stengeli TaxID=2904894 RepID=A0A9E8LPA9_9NEOP|nr:NADH dehydrogenase subunit 6 [Maesaipsyche stengeli]UZZ43659.1 NADH dehydrogenase subunit 6 [Maesaipsyche stengeli]
MYYHIILSLIMTNSLIMLSIKSPLPLGMMLMFQTLLICFSINMMINMYWISYIMYLIMLGGLLILLMYMCSIASNEMINPLKSLIIFLFMFMSMFFIFFFFLNHPITNSFNLNLENFMINENTILINKIYNKFTFKLSMMLIIYMLIILSVVSKLTNSNQGPLRPKM